MQSIRLGNSLIFLLILALYGGYYAMENPTAEMTKWFSFIPFTSPAVCMVKLSQGYPSGEGYLLIVSFFIVGLLLGRFDLLPATLANNDFSIYALYILMFLVGISIGSDEKALRAIRSQNLKIFLVPLGTIVGTLLGSFLISFFMSNRSATDCLAVGSGFGYYSLSSIFITQYKGAELGVIALMSNIIREIFTLLFAPLLVIWLGKLAPISAGGATTMDTTLPIITKYSGKEFVIIAISHGVLLDFTVPFLVTFFCKI